MFLPARRGRFLRSSSYELCLYTSLIVLEETIRMVVLLLLLCHCIGNLDLECHVGASNPDCRGRFS